MFNKKSTVSLLLALTVPQVALAASVPKDCKVLLGNVRIIDEFIDHNPPLLAVMAEAMKHSDKSGSMGAVTPATIAAINKFFERTRVVDEFTSNNSPFLSGLSGAIREDVSGSMTGNVTPETYAAVEKFVEKNLQQDASQKISGLIRGAMEKLEQAKASMEKQTNEMPQKTAARETSEEQLIVQNGQNTFVRAFSWNNPLGQGQNFISLETRHEKTGNTISQDIQITESAVVKKVMGRKLQPVTLGDRAFILVRDVNVSLINKEAQSQEQVGDNNYLLMEVPTNHGLRPRLISFHLHLGSGLKINDIRFSSLLSNNQFVMPYTLEEPTANGTVSTLYSRRGTLQPKGMPSLGSSESAFQAVMKVSGSLTPIMIANAAVPVFQKVQTIVKEGENQTGRKVIDQRIRTVYISDTARAVVQDVVTTFGKSQIVPLHGIDLGTENMTMVNFKILKDKKNGNLLGLVTSVDSQGRTVFTQFDITDREAQVYARSSYDSRVEENLRQSHVQVSEVSARK